jgi:radical SAM protein with 4Fe4S-binding SPASM domain
MDCPVLPELEFSDWGGMLLEKMKGKRIPLGGIFELTNRCNLKCVHCYINESAGDRVAQSNELTTTQVKNVIDQMADAGVLFLTLTGGDVLVRSDFAEIYSHTKQRGMLISLFTNGTLLTPKIADLLAEMKPFSIEITMYGASEEIYEQVTGISGSYKRFRNGINLLLERKLPLLLKAFIVTINSHELMAMKSLAESLGLEFRFDNIIFPRLDGNTQPLNYQISLEEIIAQDNQDPERRNEWQKAGDAVTGQLVRAENVFTCSAGVRSFHIDSQGKMSICTMVRKPAYDLKQVSFQEAWSQLGLLRTQKRKLKTICETCEIGELCSQCPGWSQIVHGDYETPVKFVCAIAHKRPEQIKNNRV